MCESLDVEASCLYRPTPVTSIHSTCNRWGLHTSAHVPSSLMTVGHLVHVAWASMYHCGCVLPELLHSAWGERLLMLVQVAAIVFLILHYRGKTRRGTWTCHIPTNAWFHFCIVHYFLTVNKLFEKTNTSSPEPHSQSPFRSAKK